MSPAVARDRSTLRDLRDLKWCSIDNDDSRDLDQLTVAQSATDGQTKILVAIADVDGLVKAKSPIDEHACINTTSIYTAAGVFPMLPERFSTNLTSLSGGEEGTAIVVVIAIGSKGEVAGCKFYG